MDGRTPRHQHGVEPEKHQRQHENQVADVERHFVQHRKIAAQQMVRTPVIDSMMPSVCGNVMPTPSNSQAQNAKNSGLDDWISKAVIA